MIPDGFAPPVQSSHGSLIDALHRAIATHPHPQRKASYGKMLAQALADQAADHASAQAPGGAAAGNPQGGPAQVPEPPAAGGYVAQNLSPIAQALVALGGWANHPALGGSIGQFAGAGVGGGGLAGILAQHAGLPPVLHAGTPTY